MARKDKEKQLEYVITDIPKTELFRIKNLWERLNEIHREESVYYKDFYKSFSFEERVKSFLNADPDKLKISIIENDNNVYGYCISSIHEDKGEIESLYVNKELRNNSYGKILVEKHIEWFKNSECKKIIVTVSYGHDSVMGFYHKLGFYERLVQLEYKQENL